MLIAMCKGSFSLGFVSGLEPLAPALFRTGTSFCSLPSHGTAFSPPHLSASCLWALEPEAAREVQVIALSQAVLGPFQLVGTALDSRMRARNTGLFRADFVKRQF